MLVGIDASRAVTAHPTGTEVYSRQLIQALLEPASWQISFTRYHFRLYFRSLPPEDLFSGIEFERMDVAVIPFPRLWTHTRLSWEMVRRPPDVLFVPAHVLPLVHPHTSLVTVHDLGYLYFPEAHPQLDRFYLDLSTRWNARVAAHILADSEATKSDLVTRYATPPDKITVAYPGRDETLVPVRDPAEIEAVKARYGIAGDYFLYVGTLQPRKNLSRIVDAFATLKPETTLVLAGRRGWLYDDLFAQVRRMGLEGRVCFPGYILDEDKVTLMSGALAFVFPSLYEGFGMPVIEAQSCGCPVIASTTSSLPEVAGDAALLVDPHDVTAIATAMRRVAADPALRENLIERGFVNVHRFSWKTCAQSVLRAIEQSTLD
ncbi:MAG: glycosyltransferase family 4 protein [Chloroflexi bacterium]|nr:glycosyltransferase family 4 protein [Chloroflexota bacterium]